MLVCLFQLPWYVAVSEFFLWLGVSPYMLFNLPSGCLLIKSQQKGMSYAYVWMLTTVLWGQDDDHPKLVGSLSLYTFYMLYLGLGPNGIFNRTPAIHISLIILGIHCHQIIGVKVLYTALRTYIFPCCFKVLKCGNRLRTIA